MLLNLSITLERNCFREGVNLFLLLCSKVTFTKKFYKIDSWYFETDAPDFDLSSNPRFSGKRSSNPGTASGKQLRDHGHRSQEVLQLHEPDGVGEFLLFSFLGAAGFEPRSAD